MKRYPRGKRGHLAHRRGAWLCLLGHEEEGRAVFEEALEALRTAPLDGYPDAWLSRWGLLACGGAPVDTAEPEEAPARAMRLHLRLALGQESPVEVLQMPRGTVPGIVRRYALGLALGGEGAPEGAFPLGWLDGAASRTRRCDPDRLFSAGALQTEPQRARRAAARVLSHAESERTLRGLGPEARSDPGGPWGDTQGYVRAVAASLRFDAGLAEAARGDYEQAHRDLLAASAIEPRACTLAALLAGDAVELPEHPDGFERSDGFERAWDLQLAGRHDAALEAALGPLDPTGPSPQVTEGHSWQLAALAALSGRWVDARLTPEPLEWLRGDPRVQRLRPEPRAARRAERPLAVGLREHAWRMFVVGRAADGFDVEAFLDRRFRNVDGRAALGARHLAALWRGDDRAAREWMSWSREVAALAPDPPRAFLLWLAMNAAVPLELEDDVEPR